MGAFIWPLLILILSRKIGYTTADIAKKKIIAVFDVISASCFFICSQIEPGNGMMFLFVVAGLFATMEAPAYDALLMELSKPAEREKAYSLNYLGHNLGYGGCSCRWLTL